MHTIQNRESRIWEMKEYKYTKGLAKNSGLCDVSLCEIFGKALYPNL